MKKVFKSSCPYCGFAMNGATCPDDESAFPKEGDISVCIQCTSFLIFGKELQLEKIPPEIILSDSDRERLWKIKRAIHRIPHDMRSGE